MGLRTELKRCEGVTTSSLFVTESERTDSDIINLAILSLVENPIQRSAITIICKKIPIIKPFVMMLLKAYIASSA